MQTTAYHTVEDRDNPREILAFGPFLCVRENAWLGRGYYFWDDDLPRAHKWGQDAYRKKGYVVCKADLYLQNVLDLCDRDGKRHFNLLLEVIKSEFAAYQMGEIPISNAIEHLRKISHTMTKDAIFPFDSVRAEDYPPDTMQPFVVGRSEAISLNPRVQICLFEKKSQNLRSFEIVYPEKYV